MPTNILAKWALVGLICGIACDAEPENLPLETPQTSEPEAVGESAVEEDEFRDWSCVLKAFGGDDDEEEEGELYCLVKCEGYEWTRALKEPVVIEEVTDKYCEKRAKKFCKKYGKKFDEWCWGEREEEEDEDEDEEDNEDKDD
jgi:hypothetical protein